MVFLNETHIPQNTLIRSKNATAEWRIRDKLIQTIQPPNPNHPAANRKNTHWLTWRKPPEIRENQLR